MYKAAQILYEKEEYYNCSYLCGYVLECALKYILVTYARRPDGALYTSNDLRKMYAHDTSKLNQELENWISSTSGIATKYRMDCAKKAPYIFRGAGGHKPWSPAYRYGEHPKWDDKDYCKEYLKESEYVFRFIAEIVV